MVFEGAGWHEFVDLGGDNRERDESGAEQRQLQLGDEIFQQCRVDELRVFRPRHPHERPHQHIVDLLGKEEAEDEGDAESEQRLDQPRAQLDQVIHQRRFAGLDIFVAHDALASLSISDAADAASRVPGAAGASRVIASGSPATACASASLKVSGIGISGVVGVTGASSFDVAGGSIAGVSLTDAAALSMPSMSSALPTSFSSEVMVLLPVKPVAASLTSSKLFLRSAISASRMASWNWPWNSAAILRALPIHCPTMRSTAGNSFGPMAISATTAMTTSSLHPMSNMKNSAHASRFHPNTCLNKIWAARVSLSRSCSAGLAQPVLPRVCRTINTLRPLCRKPAPRCSDNLAADIRSGGRGRRCIMIDRLHGLGLLRSLVIVLHALLEGLDALRDIAHQIGDLAAPEQQQDDCDHDDPVPNAKRTHPPTLQTREAGDPASSLSETRLGRCQKQGLKPRQIAVNAKPCRHR